LTAEFAMGSYALKVRSAAIEPNANLSSTVSERLR